MLLCKCLCMAAYVLVQKKYIFKDDSPDSWKPYPINVTAWCYGFGAVFMALLSIYYGVTDPSAFNLFPASLPPCTPTAGHGNATTLAPTTPTSAWCNAHSGASFNATVAKLCTCKGVDYQSLLIPLSYAAFVSSAMAYGFVSYANKHLPSTVVTAFWPMQVPVAISLTWLATGKSITGGQGLGGLLIIAALFMVCWADNTERNRRDAQRGKPINDGLLAAAAADEEQI